MARFISRDLSWLAFNARVLEEARDQTVPLLDRLKFLAIFSLNLDEFYSVRIAALKQQVEQLKREKGEDEPQEILLRLHQEINRLQEQFGSCYRDQILPELKKNGIEIISEAALTEEEGNFVRDYFKSTVIGELGQIYILGESDLPFLQSQRSYLAVRLELKSEESCEDIAIIKIPSEKLSRFFILPNQNQDLTKTRIILLDDVIRVSLTDIFPQYIVRGAYAIKVTRDADVDIEDEHSGNLYQKIKSQVRYRKIGKASRMLFDAEMPKRMQKALRDVFSIRKEEWVQGGRYHNFGDFLNFPTLGKDELQEPPLAPLPHPLETAESIFKSIQLQDYLIHYPYQTFDALLRLMNEAAIDPQVKKISITLYRVATQSKVVEALIHAARNGKKVVAFLELKARFNEESNFYWASELERAGATVLYSIPGIKVHAKILLIEREESQIVNYAYISTGNFNEKTAKIYTDHALFTAKREITDDISRVFRQIETPKRSVAFEKLMVAPHGLRDNLYELIQEEINAAKKGKKAEIIIKMNSLEDREMAKMLIKAAGKGVSVKLIIRGICIIPPSQHPNLKMISIIDRFLEHGRIYYFYQGGKRSVWIASADFMTRNLSRRIEVAVPIEEAGLKSQLIENLSDFFRCTEKRRWLCKNQIDEKEERELVKSRAQLEIYSRLNEESKRN